MTHDGGGLLSTIVYAGLALGALGLTVKLVNDISNPRQKRKQNNLYDMGYMNYDEPIRKKKSRNNDIFDWGY
jgi:hypothetical protein